MGTVLTATTGKKGLPSLRQHKRGHWFWREGGKDFYAGHDHAEAQRLWAERWGSTLALRGSTSTAPQNPTKPLPRVMAQTSQGRSVQEAADRLFSLIDSSCTPPRREVYRLELAPFLAEHGTKPLPLLSADDLLTYRSRLCADYKPWTVNGRLAILRRMLRLGDELGWIPQKLPFSLLKGVPVGETTPKAWTPSEVRRRIAKVAETNLNLARMLRLQWLAVLRPFSVPTLVFRQGEWEAKGIFILARSKTEKRTGEKQRVILSDAALAELEAIKPEYAEGRLYRQACQRAAEFAPHALRHSAATALSEADVPQEYIEVALGHTLPRVQRTYYQQKRKQAREHLSILAELVPPIA